MTAPKAARPFADPDTGKRYAKGDTIDAGKGLIENYRAAKLIADEPADEAKTDATKAPTKK